MAWPSYVRSKKLGDVNLYVRRVPLSRATPPSLRIPAEDVLGYVLTHPESSVRDISKACSYSKSTVWNVLHIFQFWGRTNARRSGASL
ncbi:DUF4817 domain-containing protein [Trichonephila clavipes]|nr:DUF4817 domain-containing protein [Trichonephila clavipes]